MTGKHSLAAGFFAGLLFVCAWGLVREARGHPVTTSELGLVVFVFGLGLSIVSGGMLGTDWRWNLRRAREVWALEQDERRAKLVPAPLPEPAPAPDVDETERAWALALERFFRGGDKVGGFSINAMSGIVGSDTWGRLTDFYCSQDGRGILRVAPGNVGTVWGHGWGLDRVLQLVALRQLPHPAGPAPDVQVPVQNATQQRAARKSKKQPTAAEMVVDG